MTVGATKELRLSVDKKRKHILCRSRPQPPLLLPLVHYYGVVEQKNALCDGGRMQCTEAPFLPQSPVFLEKSTSNCSLWFVPKMCVHCKLQLSTIFENILKSRIIQHCERDQYVINIRIYDLFCERGEIGTKVSCCGQFLVKCQLICTGAILGTK